MAESKSDAGGVDNRRVESERVSPRLAASCRVVGRRPKGRGGGRVLGANQHFLGEGTVNSSWAPKTLLLPFHHARRVPCGSQKPVRLNPWHVGAGFGGSFRAGWIDRLRGQRLPAGAARRRRGRPMGCGFETRKGSLGGVFVLVKKAAESVAPADTPLVVNRRDGRHLGERGLLFG
jgi:hypothetical protein